MDLRVLRAFVAQSRSPNILDATLVPVQARLRLGV
jgi:hypothetical protein